MVAMRKTLNISVISYSNSWMPPRSSSVNKLFHSWHGIHSRHVSMCMKFHTLLSLRHQILARCVRNLFDILYIHCQTMSERIILNTTANSYPVPLFYHIELSKLITIFNPALHCKTRGIISYLEINNNSTRLSFALLYIKNISFKNNTILFRININHWRYFSLIKTSLTLTLFLSKILVRFVHRFRCWSTLKNRLKSLSCLRFSLFL